MLRLIREMTDREFEIFLFGACFGAACIVLGMLIGELL